MISVIVPVYNDYSWLMHTLLPSIEKQTMGLSNLEVIVVDDGSELIPEDILLMNYPFVKLFKIEHSGGSAARNYGIRNSSGEYLIFPDADCLLFPNCLEKMKKVLDEYRNVTFVYCHFFMVEPEGWAQPFLAYRFKEKLLEQVNFISSVTLVRRVDDLIWDESLKRFQDWELWLRLVRKGKKGKLLEEILFWHFLRKSSVTSRCGDAKEYQKYKEVMFSVLERKGV